VARSSVWSRGSAASQRTPWSDTSVPRTRTQLNAGHAAARARMAASPTWRSWLSAMEASARGALLFETSAAMPASVTRTQPERCR
jgi:hypothetical protein